MVGAVLLALGAAAFCLAIHPFVTYPASLALLARWRPIPLRPCPGPQLSAALLVCAHNEATVIADKAANMLAMRGEAPELELLTYIDASTDATEAILRSHAPDITCVAPATRRGKTAGMNTLAKLTEADILIFSDANVAFGPQAIASLLRPFADPAVGVVCGHLHYGSAQNTTAKVGNAYWRLEERIKSLESATGSVMGADGSIFAMRRALRPSPPADLIDDMYVSLDALCQGARIVRVTDAVAFEAAVSTPEEEFRRKVRIACQAFNVHRAMRGRLRRLSTLDQYKYVSHKLLRWLVLFNLVVGGALLLAGLAMLGPFSLLLAVLVCCRLLLEAVLTVRRGPIATVRSVLAAFAATALGVLRSCQGERFQTWTPPATARAAAGQGLV